jgi:hypothetical protein
LGFGLTGLAWGAPLREGSQGKGAKGAFTAGFGPPNRMAGKRARGAGSAADVKAPIGIPKVRKAIPGEAKPTAQRFRQRAGGRINRESPTWGGLVSHGTRRRAPRHECRGFHPKSHPRTPGPSPQPAFLLPCCHVS